MNGLLVSPYQGGSSTVYLHGFPRMIQQKGDQVGGANGGREPKTMRSRGRRMLIVLCFRWKRFSGFPITSSAESKGFDVDGGASEKFARLTLRGDEKRCARSAIGGLLASMIRFFGTVPKLKASGRDSSGILRFHQKMGVQTPHPALLRSKGETNRNTFLCCFTARRERHGTNLF